MSEQTEIQYSLTVNTDFAFSEIRKLEIVLIRCLNYAQQLTGDPNLQRGIQILEKAILTLRSFQQAARAAQLAAGPIGWLYFGTTALAAGISFGNLMTDIGE